MFTGLSESLLIIINVLSLFGKARYFELCLKKPIGLLGAVILTLLVGCEDLADQNDVMISDHKIAFFEGPWFSSTLRVISDNGLEERVLVHELIIHDSCLAWSPDGSEIAFESEKEIFLIESDGMNLQQLTMSNSYTTFPAWSPEGFRISYLSLHEGAWSLNMMERSGRNPTPLTPLRAIKSPLSWSPLGDQIAFSTEAGIFLVNPDNGNLTQLTNHNSDIFPVWSPDGKRVLFVSERDGNEEIYVVNSDGTGLINLSQHSSQDNRAIWGPLGSDILFISRRDEPVNESNNPYLFRSELYVGSSDSSFVRRLTNQIFVFAPSVEPQSSRVAYHVLGQGIYVLSLESLQKAFIPERDGNYHTPTWSPTLIE